MLTASLIGCRAEMSPFWITAKFRSRPLFFQRCQHLGVKVNALDFSFILEATVTLESGLQLGSLASGLASSKYLAASPGMALVSGLFVGLVRFQLSREELFCTLGFVHLGQSCKIRELGTAI